MKDYRAIFLEMTPDEQLTILEKCGQLQINPALVMYIEELESRLAALEAAAKADPQTAEYQPVCPDHDVEMSRCECRAIRTCPGCGKGIIDDRSHCPKCFARLLEEV